MMQNWYPLVESVSGEEHIILRNNEGKEWIFPADNIKAGMNIYQPGSNRGRCIKKALPYLKSCRLILNKLNIHIKKMALCSEIEVYLNRLLGEELKYAIFFGTPSLNQKVTMQINRGKNCIAYVKISEMEHIGKYFEREYALLRDLEEKGVSNIPRAISLDKIGSHYVFVQSGDKVGNEKIPYDFGKIQLAFLTYLQEKTKVNMSFRETEYSKNIQNLLKIEGGWNEEEKSILADSINKVIDYFEEEAEYCLYHGDFTPWNTYLKNKELYAFDFEYAKSEYPKWLDFFHFHTQVWYFVDHKNKEEIWDLYRKKRREWSEWLEIENIDIYYMAYLLDMIYQNKKLEIETSKSINSDCYHLWIYLLDKLIL